MNKKIIIENNLLRVKLYKNCLATLINKLNLSEL